MNSDKIDVFELLKTIKQGRLRIVYTVLITLGLGLLYLLITEKSYKSTTELIVESGQSGSDNILQKIGSISGLGGLSGSDPSSFDPNLFFNVSTSTNFYLDLLDMKFNSSNEGDTIEVKAYFSGLYQSSFGYLLKKYTLGLPGVVKGLFSESKPTHDNEKYFGITKLGQETNQAIKILEESILVSFSSVSNILEIQVETNDPILTAQMTQYVRDYLKDYYMTYKTNKLSTEVDFLKKGLTEAELQLEATSKKLNSFRDSNINITSSATRSKLQKLESEYNIHFSITNNLSQQLESTRLQLLKQTPVFTELEPVLVPSSPSGPKKVLVFIGSILLGLLIGLALILYRPLVRSLKT